jgi:hypothetical protein
MTAADYFEKGARSLQAANSQEALDALTTAILAFTVARFAEII